MRALVSRSATASERCEQCYVGRHATPTHSKVTELFEGGPGHFLLPLGQHCEHPCGRRLSEPQVRRCGRTYGHPDAIAAISH